MFSRHSKNNQVDEAISASSLPVPCDVDKSPISRSLAMYLADPMRSSLQPDVVGKFIDPMGGSFHHSGVDPTNTGA
ncbi:hypothetical protein INT43_004926 [Umbelopsis isabellina]|uniref:Uncharacterized protein n=1 Tax=Mortierella isabellina TaxID=91625 RepID=A0A8H7PEW7_MORIS|nr:hypothetical protein INT43_004926 [Umbelopsis isabellina]